MSNKYTSFVKNEDIILGFIKTAEYDNYLDINDSDDDLQDIKNILIYDNRRMKFNKIIKMKEINIDSIEYKNKAIKGITENDDESIIIYTLNINKEIIDRERLRILRNLKDYYLNHNFYDATVFVGKDKINNSFIYNNTAGRDFLEVCKSVTKRRRGINYV